MNRALELVARCAGEDPMFNFKGELLSFLRFSLALVIGEHLHNFQFSAFLITCCSISASVNLLTNTMRNFAVSDDTSMKDVEKSLKFMDLILTNSVLRSGKSLPHKIAEEMVEWVRR